MRDLMKTVKPYIMGVMAWFGEQVCPALIKQMKGLSDPPTPENVT